MAKTTKNIAGTITPHETATPLNTEALPKIDTSSFEAKGKIFTHRPESEWTLAQCEIATDLVLQIMPLLQNVFGGSEVSEGAMATILSAARANIRDEKLLRQIIGTAYVLKGNAFDDEYRIDDHMKDLALAPRWALGESIKTFFDYVASSMMDATNISSPGLAAQS